MSFKNYSYLANICILKRTYNYKNMYVIVGLWADIDFKPKIVILENNNELISLDLNDFLCYCNKFNLQDRFEFLYCNKFCSFEVVPQIIDVLSNHSICLILYIDYLSSLESYIVERLAYFKDLIRTSTLHTVEGIHSMLVNKCDDKYSKIENEMLYIGFDFFLPYIIIKL